MRWSLVALAALAIAGGYGVWRHKVPGGHAGPAIHRKVVSIVQAKSHGPIDVGRATKSFGRNADDEELATIYEYLTHLPSS